MPRSFLLLVLATVTGVAAWPGWASAKPKSITFQDMMAQSAIVAVARRVAPAPQAGAQPKEYALELLEVLKGDIQPGRLNVPFEDVPDVPRNVTEFIVFLDKDFVWRFIATPLDKGGKVTEGALHIRGFFDHNAYYVSPGFLTRKQLETYVKTGRLVYQFRGPLYFPVKGEVAWRASPIEIEGSYDPIKGTGTVEGLPPMKELGEAPKFTIGPWEEAGIGLRFSGPKRSLELQSDLVSVDRNTHTMNLKWFAKAPDFLTQKDFETYLGDTALVDSYYRVTLNYRPLDDKEKSKVLTFHLGVSGRTGHLEGWTDKPLAASGSSSTNKYVEYYLPLAEGEELVVRIGYVPLLAGAEVMTWTFQEGLLYRLHTSDLAGAVLVRKNKEDRLLATCTASLEGIFYEKSK
jgi:hypothetical protein